MEYSELKTTCQTLYGNNLGSGSFVESDAGSPSELALLFHLIHGRIIGAPKRWDFATIIGTITSTGASSYNLKTLFPGFLVLDQVFGLDANSESSYFGNMDANITPIDGWTLRNKQLTFTGAIPPAGTIIQIQYITQYLVEDAAGTRKKYFTEEDDVSVIDDADINVLIMGIGELIEWKTDEVSSQKRKDTHNWFQEAWNNLFLRSPVSKPLKSML